MEWLFIVVPIIALDALQQSLTGNEKTIILDADSALAQILTGN